MKRRHLLAAIPAALSLRGSEFLSPSEFALLDELTETIIPADAHSGGAKAAKVAAFIAGSVNAEEWESWRRGLRLVETASAKLCGKPFVKASVAERAQVVQSISADRFFHELKRQTVSGYYTSKIGILEELEYKGNRINKDFSGCEAD